MTSPTAGSLSLDSAPFGAQDVPWRADVDRLLLEVEARRMYGFSRALAVILAVTFVTDLAAARWGTPLNVVHTATVFAMGVVVLVVLIRIRDPRRYNFAVFRVVGGAAAIMAVVAELYYGVFSAVALVVTLGIGVAGQGLDRTGSFLIVATVSIGYVVETSLVMTGVIHDTAIMRPEGMPVLWQVVVLFLVPGIMLAAFWLARLELSARRSALTLAFQAHEKTRRALQDLVVANEEIRNARDSAESAGRAKTAFLANMSHEIRTPLHGVIAAAGLLLTGLDDPQKHRHARVIRDSAEQLLVMLNQVLDAAKIEAGWLELTALPFDPGALAEEAADTFSATAARKGVELSVRLDPELPRRVCGDPDRLRQVLLNLVGNAVKFTDEGEVVVRALFVGGASGAASGGASNSVVLRYEVMDTGLGIAPGDLPRLFEPFSQAEHTSGPGRGGTGLGLSISRQIVERMGGRIDVQSTPGQGSVFSAELRLDAPPELAIDLRPERAEEPRVLVVEDNELGRELIVQMLAALGVESAVAADGAEAVRMLEEQRFDALLMDLQMPVMDGLAAVAEIRRREAGGRHTPVVALTARDLPDDRARCLEAGMDDYLTKPVRLGDLRRMLQRFGFRLGSPPPQGSPSAART